MKRCELCGCLANMFCESDQANLCWDCDFKTHSGNFLFSKHSRTILCQSCQSLTPWTASGPKLDPIVLICNNCFSSGFRREKERDSENGEEDDVGDDSGDDEEDDDDDDGEDENDEDVQVVP